MMKRAQVTIFIILALVILTIVGVIAFYYTNLSNLSIKDINLPQDIKNYKKHLSDCIQTVSQDSVTTIGQTSGYYILPKENFQEITAYYYYNKQNLVPSIEKIESEINKYIEQESENCKIEKFGSELETNANTIIKNNIETEITIKQDITYNDQEYKIKETYKNEYDIALRKLRKVAEEIIDLQVKDPKNICYSCILELADSNNIKIDITSFENTILFILTDEDYIFTFANQY